MRAGARQSVGGGARGSFDGGGVRRPGERRQASARHTHMESVIRLAKRKGNIGKGSGEWRRRGKKRRARRGGGEEEEV